MKPKNIFERVLLIFGSLFLAGQSYKMLFTIHEYESDSWLLAFLFGFIINLIILGVFAFAGFALPTQKLLPEAYYKIQNPKRLKTVFKKMNVELFRKFLLVTFWKSEKQRAVHFDGTISGIENLETQSKKAEFGHLIPFVLVTFLTVYLLVIGLWKLGVSTFLLNVLGNFYPIILQRHHRMRIQILRKRYGSKVKTDST